MPLQLDQKAGCMFADSVQCDLILTTDLLRDELSWKLLLNAAPDLRSGSIGAEQTSFAGMKDHYAVIVKRRSSFGSRAKTKIVNFVHHVKLLLLTISPCNGRQFTSFR